MSCPSLFEIEATAGVIAKIIKFGDVFPTFRYRFLLDLIRSKFKYTVHVMPDDMLVEAAFVNNPDKCLFIKASVHSVGLKGAPHPLMVLLHELVHIFLKHEGVRKKVPGLDISTLSDQGEKVDEWITNRVAGAIAMPFDEAMAERCNRWKQLVQLFHVTPDAARLRINQIRIMAMARPAGAPKPKPKPPTSAKFWAILQDYETQTHSSLQSLDSARETPGSKGILLESCSCGGTTCTNDGRSFRCDGCAVSKDPSRVILISVRSASR